MYNHKEGNEAICDKKLRNDKYFLINLMCILRLII